MSAAPVSAMTLKVPGPGLLAAAGGSPRAALLAYFDPARRAWVPVAGDLPLATALRACVITGLDGPTRWTDQPSW